MQKVATYPSFQQESIDLRKLQSDLENLNEDRWKLIQGYVGNIFQAHLLEDLMEIRRQLATENNPPLYTTYNDIRRDLIQYTKDKASGALKDPWRVSILESNDKDTNLRLHKASGHIHDVLAAVHIIAKHPLNNTLLPLKNDIDQLKKDLKENYSSLLDKSSAEKASLILEGLEKIEGELAKEKYHKVLRACESLQAQLKASAEESQKSPPLKASGIGRISEGGEPQPAQQERHRRFHFITKHFPKAK